MLKHTLVVLQYTLTLFLVQLAQVWNQTLTNCPIFSNQFFSFYFHTLLIVCAFLPEKCLLSVWNLTAVIRFHLYNLLSCSSAESCCSFCLNFFFILPTGPLCFVFFSLSRKSFSIFHSDIGFFVWLLKLVGRWYVQHQGFNYRTDVRLWCTGKKWHTITTVNTLLGCTMKVYESTFLKGYVENHAQIHTSWPPKQCGPDPRSSKLP